MYSKIHTSLSNLRKPINNLKIDRLVIRSKHSSAFTPIRELEKTDFQKIMLIFRRKIIYS